LLAKHPVKLLRVNNTFFYEKFADSHKLCWVDHEKKIVFTTGDIYIPGITRKKPFHYRRS
jgi:hypothetical protein